MKTEEENNRLIAEFMGLKWIKQSDNIFPSGHYEKGEDWYGIDFINYATSWDWLMPVIEKISRIEYGRSEDGIDTAYPRTFGMLNNDGKPMFRINRYGLHEAQTLIEAAYEGVIEFIEHHDYIHTINQTKEG